MLVFNRLNQLESYLALLKWGDGGAESILGLSSRLVSSVL